VFDKYQEREQFLAELDQLLVKWQAELYVEENGSLAVYFSSIEDSAGEIVRPYDEFELW
jgi:hypothetical protein